MISFIGKTTYINTTQVGLMPASLLLWLFVTCLCFIPIDLSANPRESIQQASQMIEKGNASGAYQILEFLEDEYAGWWEYDYVLGVAALESGQANLAIIALQRAYAMNPRLAGVHIDLGRAYYEVNEYDTARIEFELALSKKPHPAAEKVAKTYLRLLTPTQAKKSRRTSFNVFAASSGGYDTNANSSTNAKIFEGFELAEENIQTPSLFVSAKVGIQGAFKVSPKDTAIFTANYTQRYNKDALMVNFTSFNALGLWRYNARDLERNVGIQLQKTDIASDLESFVTAFTYSQSTPVFKALYFNLFSSLSNIDFGTELSERNAMQFIAGGGFSIKPKRLYAPTLHLSSLAGKYHPKESGSKHEKYLAGGRIVLNKKFKLFKPGSFSVSGGAMYSDYVGLFSSTERKEVLVDGSFNIALNPNRYWELFFNSSYTRNLSTVNLFDYSRLNTSAGIKYTF